MIGKFLASRLSGYIAIAGIVALLGMVWYIYSEGKAACRNQAISDRAVANTASKKGADSVHKEEQSLDTSELDRQLCSLGIVRGRAGCK